MKARDVLVAILGDRRATWRRTAATPVLAFVAALALAGSASAATVETHPHIASLVPPATATPVGPFEPISVAVNQTTGNIYAVDAQNDVIDIFRPNGTFLAVIDGSDTPGGHFEFGETVDQSRSPIAIDNSGGPNNGRVYVENRGLGQNDAVFALSPTGTFLFAHPFNRPFVLMSGAGLDVDSKGALVIAGEYDLPNPGGTARFRINTYPEPKAELPAESVFIDEHFAQSGPEHIGIGSLSLDSNDDPYLTSFIPSRLGAVDRSGRLRWQAVTSGRDNAVEVDRSTDAVYAIEGVALVSYGEPDDGNITYVSRYNVDGQLQEGFGLSILSEPRDVTVNETSGSVYVADLSNNAVEVFGPELPATAPDAGAVSVTAVTDTTATFNGTVNPQGTSASWRFQYRRQGERAWASTGLESAGSGVADVAVSTGVSGLSQNSTYEVRLQTVDTDSGAMFTSGAITFATTGQQQAIVTIGPAGPLTPTGAHLSGTIDPNGSDATWHFEYATDPSFDDLWSKVGSDQTVSAGSGATPVGADLTGLRPNTHYFIRLIGTNQTGGPKASSVDEFTTPPAPPVVFTLAAGCLAQTGACLGGNVDPKNSPTTYYFEYGLDGSYGNAVPAGHDGDAGSEFGAGRVVERISNLTPNTTYHYRLVAENAAGPTFGPDMRFKTRPDSATTAQMEAGWQSRGTELVNPPDKGNQAVYPAQKAQPWISVSPDGNRVLWKTANGGPDSSTGALSNFISDYTPDGWTSHNVLPEASELPGGAGDNYFGTPLGFTPDFSSMLFLSARGVDKAHYSKTLIKVDDQRHATLLEEYDPLANANQLFEVSQPAAGGKAVVGGGTASPGGPYPLTIYGADGTARPVQVPACGYSQIIARTPENIPLVDLNSASSWVNADATRIFVYSSGDADCSAPPAIYMLEPDTGAATRISGEQNAAAGFLRANSAGTEVLFSKAGDLYKWSNEGGEECLSCGSGFEIKTGTASADLSHVYFCGPVPPASPPAVDCAIYVWRASGISFVAEKSEVPGKGVDEKRFPLQLDRSGDQMIFESTRPYVATADDTGWNGDLLFTGAAFTQLYRYDDTAGEVECLTCTDPVSGALPPPELTLVNNRPTLSADGQTIAFATSSRLTPADINGRFDVYEWHQGLFRLVTDGESEFEASLSGMPRVWGLSGDGRNLIFSAGGVAITGNEMDTYSNVYAARTGSAGFPPSLPPAHCVEDSCQGALESPPPLPPAASSSYAGAGNVPAAKRHKRKHKKARHHRRHKQGGKHKPKQSHKRGGQQ